MTTPSGSVPPAPGARDLFLEALEKEDPRERAGFLDGACRGDARLRAAVEDLLANHREDSFLEDPAVDLRDLPTVAGAREELASHQAGDSVGPYKLLQRIGEGGFGTVWMAEQTAPVTRRVALKIIKLGMDTREVIARFEAERQALAMMDHPNIAKVLDAGATEGGRPFFAMELVKGIPITEFCDERQLGTRERLELFGDVCAAINHAHQKGIIHRDIKPSNVLVTLHGDKAVVKVIDFGIAKATQGRLTDKTLFTRFEQFVGTPVYMSPEQAALSGLDIDTRSDIYALGVLLYELLTGKPPFDARTLASAGYDEMRRIIREVEPPRPSARLSTVAGKERESLARARHADPGKLGHLVEADLDWIVMKAIEKDRSRRYETANGLAEDIRRFLRDEPVSAGPPTTAYRLRKFARRNRGILRAAAGIALLLIVATFVSTWQAVEASAARDREAKQRRLAEAKAREAGAVLAFFEDQVLAAVRPIGKDGGLGVDVTVREAIDAAEPRIAESLRDQPLVEASIRRALGKSYNHLDRPADAERQLRRALELRTSLLGREHPATVDAIAGLAFALTRGEQWSEALELSEEALAIRERTLGPDHPDTIDSLVLRGVAFEVFAKPREVVALWEDASERCRKVLGDDAGRTLIATENLALAYLKIRRVDEAVDLLEGAVAARSRTIGPTHPDTWQSLSKLAKAQSMAGRWLEALRLQEQVLDGLKKAFGPEHGNTLIAMNNLADSYNEVGRFDEAIALCEEVVAINERTMTVDHPRVLRAMATVASFYSSELDRHEEAIAMLESVIRKLEGFHDPDHRDSLDARRRLAVVLASTGRFQDALDLAERTAEDSKRVLGEDHPDTMLVQEVAATACYHLGRYADGLSIQEKVLEFRRATLGAGHPDTLAAMSDVASAYSRAGRNAEAVAYANDIINSPEEIETPRSRVLSKLNVAVILGEAGKWGEAIELQEETIEEAEALLGPAHGFTIQLMRNLAISLTERGEGKRAIAIGETVLARCSESWGRSNPKTLEAMTGLAEWLAKGNEPDRAIRLLEEARLIAESAYGAESAEAFRISAAFAYVHDTLGRTSEARAYHEEALAGFRRTLGSHALETIDEMGRFATSYFMEARYDEALTLFEEVLKLVREIGGPWSRRALDAMQELARCYCFVGRREEAITMMEDALRHELETNGPRYESTLGVQAKLAQIYLQLEENAKALDQFEQGLEIRSTTCGPDHSQTLLAKRLVAEAALANGDLGRALTLRTEVVDALNRQGDTRSPMALDAKQELALAYLAAGRITEAVSDLRDVVQLSRDVRGPEATGTLDATQNLAVALINAGPEGWDEAMALLEEILSIERRVLPAGHPDFSFTLTNLGQLLVLKQRTEEADKVFAELAALPVTGALPSRYGVASPDAAEASAEVPTPDSEAVQWAKRVLLTTERAQGADDPQTIEARRKLAEAYRADGRDEDAEAIEQEMAEASASSP